MYKRYYQGYDRYNVEPQRPIGLRPVPIPVKTQNNRDEPEDIEKQSTTPAEPEIIVPEKPYSNAVDMQTAAAIQQNPIGFYISKVANFFKNFKVDDIILLALIVLFLQDECKDYSVVVILLFLFFIGL